MGNTAGRTVCVPSVGGGGWGQAPPSCWRELLWMDVTGPLGMSFTSLFTEVTVCHFQL